MDEVLASPVIADPLHRLDCCVVSDGGGALVVTSAAVARGLKRPLVRLIGAGEAMKGQDAGAVDLTYSGAVWSGPAAFAMAGVQPGDIQYASIYDSFTITVLIQFWKIWASAPRARRPVRGGRQPDLGHWPPAVQQRMAVACATNHPANRGGITKVIEAVRQLRGEAHPAVQVPDCTLALAHGTGGPARQPARLGHT